MPLVELLYTVVGECGTGEDCEAPYVDPLFTLATCAHRVLGYGEEAERVLREEMEGEEAGRAGAMGCASAAERLRALQGRERGRS
jgi:hypothetical protein